MRPALPFRSALPIAAVLLLSSAPFVHAQAMHMLADAPPAALVAASAPAVAPETSSSSADDLPAAPSAMLDDAGQAGAPTLTTSTANVAHRYSGIILPGQFAQPLSAGQKVTFGFVQAASPFNIVAWAFSAAYSQAVDSAPHYGQGWGPFGQRYGASAARGTMQTLATDSVFAPIFHDDPRYYELGRQHKIINRGIYAATRTVITRSDSGKQRLNIPLLAGYAVAAGASNVFVPERDRTASQTAQSYAGSIGGAALGFLFNEFLDDGLRIAHLRK